MTTVSISPRAAATRDLHSFMKRPQRPPVRGHYALTFVAALTLWSLLPAVREPAYSGALGPVGAVRAGAATARPAPRSPAVDDRVTSAAPAPSEHRRESPETDVIAEPFPLVAAQFDALTAGATLTLPNPNGGDVVLRVDAVQIQGNDKHLRLSHAGFPSSVTLTPRQFFATVATPDGVYALSGDSQGTHLIRHSELDLRNLHVADYRPARL